MQRLLQDTKEVRSEHVVGLGSATYGSLVRRLLGGRYRRGRRCCSARASSPKPCCPISTATEAACLESQPRRARTSCWRASGSHRGTDRRFTVLDRHLNRGARRLAPMRRCGAVHSRRCRARCGARRTAWRSAVTEAVACCIWASIDPAGTAWDGIDGLVTLRRTVRAARYAGRSARRAAGPRAPRLLRARRSSPASTMPTARAPAAPVTAGKIWLSSRLSATN